MGSELAVIERLNQLQITLEKVERTVATIVTTAVQARQTTEAGYLDIIQAATYLHVSVSTLRAFVRTKGLPHHKPGKTLLFRTKDIDAWMQRYRHGDRGMAVMGFNDRMIR